MCPALFEQGQSLHQVVDECLVLTSEDELKLVMPRPVPREEKGIDNIATTFFTTTESLDRRITDGVFYIIPKDADLKGLVEPVSFRDSLTLDNHIIKIGSQFL